MDRLNYYYRQKITHLDMRELEDHLEAGLQNMATDIFATGMISGGNVTPHNPANMTVDISPGRGYDPQGRRLYWGTTVNLSVATDENGNSTAVSSGQERWVAIVVRFARVDSDPRIDGNGQQVMYRSDEAVQFGVIAGAAAAAGSAQKPAIPADAICLGDVKITYGMIAVTSVDTSRYTRMSAHPASEITIQDAGGKLAATNVEDAFQEHVGAGGGAHAVATTSSAGFMSSSDKSKLDSVQAGAEVNQNAFAQVKVGATTIAADAEQDTLELAAGTGISLTPDATNDKVTVAVSMSDTVHGNRGGGSLHTAATTSTAGFMSAADKAKLDGIAAGAEVNQNAFTSVKAVASDGTTSRGQVDADAKTDLLTLKEGQNVSLAVDATNDVVTIGVNTSGLNADTVDGQHASAFASASHSHANATSSAAGFMSATDKAKLDGIASGAEVNQNAFSVVQAQDGSGAAIGSVSADSKTDTVNFRAGTGIGLSVSGDVITISSTASQNAFTNVAVSGQSTVAADSPSDTLTLAGTGGVTVTTDASTDTVTIGFAMTDAVHGNRGGGSLHAVATTSSAGFMSASDKSKLDGIQSGAQVNQNAFGNVKVGTTTIAADSATDTLELVAGANISLTPDATNDKVTIAVTGVAQASHTHAGSDITSKVASATNADAVPWTGVTGKPSTFAPSAHTHAGSDITSAVANATNADTVDGQHASAFASASHTHAGSAITSAVAQATNADTVDSLHASSFGRVDAATSVNARWTFNTTNGRLVAPVGTDKYATA